MANGSLAGHRHRLLPLRFWIALLVAIAFSLFFAFSFSDASADTSTTAVTVCLQSSTGAALGGGNVQYHPGSGLYSIGHTDPTTGCVTGNVPNNTDYIRLDYRHGKVTQPFSPSTTNYTFQTALVTLLNTNRFCYVGNTSVGCNYFAYPSNSQELLPGTYTFKNWSNLGDPVEINVPSTGFTGGIVHLRDHNGNGLAGGSASYYASGWHGIPGSTDANGNLVFSAPSNLTAISMNYKGGIVQQSKAELNASNYTFQTVLATVKLEDADGQPLDTGSVSFFAGTWQAFGTTSGGQVTMELLPRSYSFVMNYNHSRQQLSHVDLAANPVVVFQTGRLSLYYSGSIQWYLTGWRTFDKPTMEFLPGTITFYFGGTSCQAPVTIASGDHLVKSMVEATLTDHAGTAAAGGEASAYIHGWHPIGTTNSHGVACKLFDGQLGNVTVAMVYGGTRQQITQHQPTNSIYAFHAGQVTIELRDSGNNLIDTGAASYYARGWHNLGNTSGGKVTVDILPGSYSFAMVYNGTREQLNHVAVSNGSTVTFQTTGVTVYLHRSTGEMPTVSGGTASYYARGWHPIGTTGDNGQTTVEMLPGNYSFAMVLNGTREQKNGVNISGTTDNVDFQTTLATVLLRTPDGFSPIQEEASFSYYARGWHTVTTDTGYTPFLMMPGNYSFAVVYKGTREQVNHVAVSGATTNVKFLTTSVHSTSNSATSYYARGWHTFTQDMNLLPGQYWFRYNDGTPQTKETLTGGGVSTIH